MALEDQAALKIQVPNAGETLGTVANLARTAADLRLKSIEERKGNLDVGNLERYNKSNDVNDLQGSPELYHSAVQGQTANTDLQRKTLASDAYAIRTEADPVKKKQMWKESLDKHYQSGMLNRSFYTQHRDGEPDDAILDRAVRLGLDVPNYRDTTGQAAKAKAGAAATFDSKETDPTKEIIFPATRPNAPSTNTDNVFGSSTVTPTANTQSTMPGVQPKPAVTPNNRQADPYYEEAPVQSVAPAVPEGYGIVQSGVHPAVREASQLGLKNLTGVAEEAQAAAKTKASLGTMQSELESGKVKTDRIADLKMAVGGLLNTVMPTEQASKLIGMDLPSAEVLRKEMVRSGLLFARQTEGAREAVMAIQIALGANPQMMNTVDGNKKIVNILKAAADYDVEKGKAAHAYFNKQKDNGPAPHLVGFENWFSNAHSPAQFMSKAVPYQIPPNPKELRDGVTYEWKDKAGKPASGVYSSSRGGFVNE